MDFDGWANSLGRQFAVIADAPVPFAVAVILVGLAIWKAMSWRYDSIIGRLRDEVVYLEKSLTRPNASASELPAAQEGKPSLPLSWPPTVSTAASDPVALESQGRRFLPESVTPRFIAQIHRDLTALQASKITDRYLGSWMKVTGVVLNTRRAGKQVIIQVHQRDILDLLDTGISIFFSKNHDAVELVPKGSTITCQGEVKEISSFGIILEQGEILS